MTTKFSSKPFLIGSVTAALVCGIAGYAWCEEHREPLMEIYAFNLKSGSSVFIRTPDDKRILINGGANSEVIRELTKILPFYSRRIDTIIATDIEDSDISGLIDVIERYAVDRVIIPAINVQTIGLASSTNQAYAIFLDTVHRLKIPLEKVSAGDKIDLGQKIGGQKAYADILFPVASSSFMYSRASPPEIIMKISYGQTSFVLLGNATTKVQRFLASSSNMETDVAVIPHSLSGGSLYAHLMDEMKPGFLIYSQAINASSKKTAATKDSPSKSKKVDPLYFILEDKRFNLKETGTVKIISDGSNITVSQ
jgi:beta-lactamase superfamily II metal-dependent hydrolase